MVIKFLAAITDIMYRSTVLGDFLAWSMKVKWRPWILHASQGVLPFSAFVLVLDIGGMEHDGSPSCTMPVFVVFIRISDNKDVRVNPLQPSYHSRKQPRWHWPFHPSRWQLKLLSTLKPLKKRATSQAQLSHSYVLLPRLFIPRNREDSLPFLQTSRVGPEKFIGV